MLRPDLAATVRAGVLLRWGHLQHSCSLWFTRLCGGRWSGRGRGCATVTGD